MEDIIDNRFQELIQQGNRILDHIPWRERGSSRCYYVSDSELSIAQAWLSSCANLLKTLTQRDSHYCEECERLFAHEHAKDNIPTFVIGKMLGLMTSAQQEWSNGLLRRIEYIVSASTFDEFLEHAATYHKGNKKLEAAVLASAVLEDTVKKIARKHAFDPSGKSLEELIDVLLKAEIWNQAKAKRIKGHAAVRNHALHAEWDSFDIKDVGELIKGTRDLVENYL